MVKPEILIVDEILAVGDVAFRKKCEKRMQEMFGGGTTLLYVSHNIDSIRELCSMHYGLVRVKWLCLEK